MLPSGILIRCTGPFWSGSLCLFGFCLPSLRCLISALTQAGGGGLLFRFASSVQSCYGEGGGCRQMSLCVGSARRVPATLGLPRIGVSVISRLHCSGSRLLYMERALRWVRFQFSGPPQKRGFGCASVHSFFFKISYMRPYVVCLSLSTLFHLKECPQGPPIFSQMARLHLFLWLNNIPQ